MISYSFVVFAMDDFIHLTFQSDSILLTSQYSLIKSSLILELLNPNSVKPLILCPIIMH